MKNVVARFLIYIFGKSSMKWTNVLKYYRTVSEGLVL